MSELTFYRRCQGLFLDEYGYPTQEEGYIKLRVFAWGEDLEVMPKEFVPDISNGDRVIPVPCEDQFDLTYIGADWDSDPSTPNP